MPKHVVYVYNKEEREGEEEKRGGINEHQFKLHIDEKSYTKSQITTVQLDTVI
jgi:hypothetical protein